MRNRIMAATAVGVISSLLGGCASTYVSPPTGPATAEITVTFTGHSHRLAKFASIFEDPFECRSWQRIEIGQALAATIIVPARSTTLQLLSAGGRFEGYQTVSSQRCDVIVSFEPKAGRKYSLSHVDDADGCRVQMISEIDGVRRDETDTLTRRVVLPLDRISKFEARPRLCADTYRTTP
jgi:hypothetical protein